MSGTTGTPATISTLLSTQFEDGQPAGSITPQRVRNLIATIQQDNPFFVATAAEYGVKADGSTDDSSAWSSVMSAAGANGGIVIAPHGVSIVNSAGVTIPAGVTLLGSNDKTGSGAPSKGSIIKSTDATGSNAVITLAGHCGMVGISVVGPGTDGYGNGTSRPCIYISSTGRCSLEDCAATNGATGLDFNYLSENFVNRCIFQSNQTGLKNPVDSHINSCALSSNSLNAYFAPGANHNMVVGCRIEWATNYGINVDGYSGSPVGENTFIGCTFDRNGKNALRMGYARHTTVTGCIFERSAPNATANTADDAHLQLYNCITTVVTGCTSLAAQDDSNAGTFSPSYGVYDAGGNTYSLIKSNVWVYHSVDGTNGGGINSTTTFTSFASDNVSVAATSPFVP